MHPKVEVINQDAYIFLEQNQGYYDVIIIDLPDPKTIEIGRLYSHEFYQLCQKRLRPHGLIVSQAGSPYYAWRAFQCVDTTMQSAGFTTVPLHNQVITLGEWGWIIGAKGISREDLLVILRGLNFDQIQTKWINHQAMSLITSFGKDFFNYSKDPIEVNTIHNPVLYKYYLKGKWDLY